MIPLLNYLGEKRSCDVTIASEDAHDLHHLGFALVWLENIEDIPQNGGEFNGDEFYGRIHKQKQSTSFKLLEQKFDVHLLASRILHMFLQCMFSPKLHTKKTQGLTQPNQLKPQTPPQCPTTTITIPQTNYITNMADTAPAFCSQTPQYPLRKPSQWADLFWPQGTTLLETNSSQKIGVGR